MAFIGVKKQQPKKRGTVLTDYGKEVEGYTSKLKDFTEKWNISDASIERKQIGFSTLNAPTLLADESAIKKKKRKKVSAARLQGGRLSTILSETLG